MLKKSYILNFIIDAKFNIQNICYFCLGTGRRGVWLSLGGNTPPERNTAWNKGRKCFLCLGAPNNLIRPWGSTSLLYSEYRVFARGKTAGAWRWPPTPSSAEVKERVDLYLYSNSRPSWPVLGWPLPLRGITYHTERATPCRCCQFWKLY